MQIDRIIYPVTSLGPGERLVIWTVGCSARCKGCSNPELQHGNVDKDVCVSKLAEAIRQAVGGQRLDGVTVTGGEPFEQARELTVLLSLLSEITDDILLYTGKRFEEVKGHLKHVSVLIDGEYIQEQNDGACALRGSANQRIHYLDEGKRAVYGEYIAKGRTVQNVFFGNKIISAGIHNREEAYERERMDAEMAEGAVQL
jgi:anaerobic ribonucleoside-triphosphate reductase activating protein